MISLESREETVFITEFRGSYNIGAFGLATDRYALVGPGFRDKDIKMMENVLGVPVYTVTVDEEPLVGTYAVGNAFGLLLPHNTREHEFNRIKDLLPDVEVEIVEFKTQENALGNILLVNDKGALIEESIYKRNKRSVGVLEDALNVEVLPIKLDTPVIGGLAVANNNGALVSPLLDDGVIEEIKTALRVDRIGKGTGNMGSPIVGACFIVNSKGIIAGLKTTGLELQRAYELLL